MKIHIPNTNPAFNYLSLNVALLLFWGQTYGQKVLTLQECLRYGAENNPQLAIRKLDINFAREQKNELVGSALPQISGTSQLDNNLKLQKSLLPAALVGGKPGDYVAVAFGQKYNFNSFLNATLDIYNHSFWVGLRAYKFSLLQAEENVAKVKQDIAYNISSAYYQAIIANLQKRLIEDNLKRSESLLKNAQLEMKGGITRQVDVNRIKVNRNNLNYQLQQSDITWQQALVRLKNAMGMSVTEPVVLADTSLNLPAESLKDRSGFRNYSARPDYRLTELNIHIADMTRQNNMAGYYPRITASTRIGEQAQRQQFDFFEAGKPWYNYQSVSFALNIPIFDGLQRSYRNQQNLIRIDQAKKNLEYSKQAIDAEVENASLAYESRLQNILSFKENLDLAQEVLDVTRLEYKNGVNTAQALVDAENSLTQARNNYTNSLLNLYLGRLDLEKAKGNLMNYLNNQSK